jgi:spermidine/putrescine transport system permease protein
MATADVVTTVTATAAVPATVPAPAPRRRRGRRRPVVLEAFTWLYLAWSILPIAIAVLFSFNSGKSQSTQQGFSTRWYTGNFNGSVLHSTALHDALVQTLRLGVIVTLITVPLGVAFAVGIDRWRSRTSNGINLVMVFSFVVPELLLAVALVFFFQQLFTSIHLGTEAEVAALVVWNLSWPAVIVRARLASIGYSYEEAAADLGASTLSAVRRVLLPLLSPAIFASAVLVFAGVIDDFVIVQQLSSSAATQPVSVLIYSQAHGGLNGPALNALATIILALSLVVAVVGYLAYRVMTRGERGGQSNAIESIAGL